MMPTESSPHTLKGGPTGSRAWGHSLTGQAIGDFAKSVWAAFPDASLELISIGDTGGGLVAIQWILHGTHTGPLMDGIATYLPLWDWQSALPCQSSPKKKTRSIQK